jgi:threonine dehydrogenase-like Zn-dependent dehydrogenase
MARMRKIAAIDAKGRGCVLEQEIPELKKGSILVKVHASLLSPGTELSNIRTLREATEIEEHDPKPFGYENSGEVLEVGEGVTRIKPGDRVSCLGGGYAPHANYAVVPQNLCAILPDNVSYEAGAFSNLVLTSLQTMRRGQPEFGEYLLVVGLGLVGQMAARLGQIAGMYVMGWDMVPFRTEFAKGWGIDDVTIVGQEDIEAKAKAFTNDYGFDMAVMAMGGDGTKALESVRDVMKLTPDGHQMGRICLPGGLKTTTGWGATLGNLDLRCCSRCGPGYHDESWEFGETEYPNVFVRWHTLNNLEYAMRLVSEGKLDLEGLITHRMKIDQVDEAITMHVETPDKILGTIFEMEHDD